jgi:hypothetical protein
MGWIARANDMVGAGSSSGKREPLGAYKLIDVAAFAPEGLRSSIRLLTRTGRTLRAVHAFRLVCPTSLLHSSNDKVARFIATCAQSRPLTARVAPVSV